MKFLNFDRVLCLSPHPDDTEYSIAGAILKHPDTHFDILCLTQGGDCDSTTSSDRIDEVINSWSITTATNYTLHFSDVKFLKDRGVDEWIYYIETNFTKNFNYDCIMTTSEHDSHFEHVLVSSFAAPLARIKPYSIIQYRSPSTLDKWTPNLFVSLENFYYNKKKMLQEFKSQLHHEYFGDVVLDGFHTNFQCMKKGRGFVESYKIITQYA
jgi:LmbE family N-acetylglucosaminyl deacetylase